MQMGGGGETRSDTACHLPTAQQSQPLIPVPSYEFTKVCSQEGGTQGTLTKGTLTQGHPHKGHPHPRAPTPKGTLTHGHPLQRAPTPMGTLTQGHPDSKWLVASRPRFLQILVSGIGQAQESLPDLKIFLKGRVGLSAIA